MKRTFPKYAKPPVVELVLGVQFDPIPGFTGGHSGWFWKEHLGASWKASDAAPVGEATESFGPKVPPKMMLQLREATGVSRLMVENETGDRLVQMQRTRFHYNWRKGKTADDYPHYEAVYTEFLRHYTAFRAFVRDTAKLGMIVPNQWELSYIDSVPPGELWQTPADLANVFPGLFPPKRELAGLALELAATERTYEIAPQRGRLHIAADLAFLGDNPEPTLLVRTTARGPLGADSDESMKEALDTGHDAAGEAFDKLASDKAKQHWEQLS